MASVFEATFNNKHGVAESTLMCASFSGAHFYNMESDVDLDNGSVSVLDVENYKEDDVFMTAVPKVTDKIVLILNPVKIYEDYMTQMQEECYWYAKKGERVRAYEVYDTDRFSLSVEAFAEDAEPAVGKYVVVDGAGYKLTVVESKPEGYGFIGKIISQNANGTYEIFVIRNRAVEA